MLGKYLDGINSRGVILASASIGRAKVCRLIGLDIEIKVSGFPEDQSWRDFESPSEYALFNARQKAFQINSEKVVIAADTIVVLDGEVYEKPLDRDDAIRMMRNLSNRTHCLVTAIVVKGKITQELIETTELTVDELSDEAIEAIANTPSEWEAHSGGYSIDATLGATIFTKVNGSYHNILGLPAHSLAKMILKEHLDYLKHISE